MTGTHHFDTRLDHKLGESSDFALRYSCADRLLFEPFAGAAFARIPGFGNDVERRAQNVMASETHVFTPQLINEVRLGFNRIAAGAFQENQDVSLNRRSRTARAVAEYPLARTVLHQPARILAAGR